MTDLPNHLFAEPQEPSQLSPAQAHAELKRDIASLETELLKLKSRLAELESELGVSVPAVRAKGEIIINVLPDGHVIVDKVKLSKKALAKKLMQFEGKSEGVGVRIRGSSTVQYQQIVEIIDLCQKVGIANISFATQSQKK